MKSDKITKSRSANFKIYIVWTLPPGRLKPSRYPTLVTSEVVSASDNQAVPKDEMKDTNMGEA